MPITNLLDSYVSIPEHITMHLTPKGANVSGRIPMLEKIQNRGQSTPTANINDTAREVLLRCDGDRTVREIVEQLLNSSSPDPEIKADQFSNGIVAFIQQALQHHILKSHKLPQKCFVHTTGSIEYFIPQHISIELMSNCNLKCVYCYREAEPGVTPYLPGEKIICILKKLANYGLRSVELTGGEPTLHPDFLDILEFCAQHFDHVPLLTNGTKIDSRMGELLGQYKKTVVVQTDIDGSTPTLHNTIRGMPRAFERTTRGIRLLTENGVKTRVAMNIIRENIYDIENTFFLAKSLGATWFVFVPVLNFGRGRQLDNIFSEEEFVHLHQMDKRLREEHNSIYINADVDKLISETLDSNCGAGYRSVTMDPMGTVRPCPLLPKEYLSIGDLSTQKVPEVFSNPVVNKLYELHYPNPKTCAGCDDELYCRYCHVRGILNQSKRSSNCNWIETNELDKWFSHIPTNQDVLSYSDTCRSTNTPCTSN